MKEIKIVSRWDFEEVLWSGKAKSIKDALTDANLIDANLEDANLEDANLIDANLARANLARANLARANLARANLEDANLEDANLTGANFTGANLTRADITGAKYSLLSLFQAYWGVLPDKLTLELMRHDAEFIGDNAMQKWAEGGPCSYQTGARDFHFNEQRELWAPGAPELRGRVLFEALCKAKGIKIGEEKKAK